jgi:hypothetical protein
MVDMAAIASAASALKTAIDIGRTALGLRDTASIRTKVTEMQGEISSALASAIAAQQDQIAILKHVGELEKEIADLKTWEAEKRRYSLRELPPGVFVRALKPEMAGGEPPHFICETCFQRGKKRILNSDEERNGIYHLKCHECDTTLRIGHVTSRAQRADTDYDPFTGR